MVLLIQRCPSQYAKIQRQKWDRKWGRRDAMIDQQVNARQVTTAKKPGRYSDGGGLYLVIDDNRRRWVFRYTRRRKTTELGLGSARDVSLSKAREEADVLRQILRVGK